MATILLTDKDVLHQKRLCKMLKGCGHDVLYARHLAEANRALSDLTVDLMILDLDKDSLEDVTSFVARWQGVGLLFQASNPVMRNDFRTWLADDLVMKYDKAEKLLSAVKRSLNKSAMVAVA